MTTPISEREFHESLMVAMLRFGAVYAEQGRCGCAFSGPDMAERCPHDLHGERRRNALALLCHEISEFAEDAIEEAARIAEAHNAATAVIAAPIRALAPKCEACGGSATVLTGDGAAAYCARCSKGLAYRHLADLEAKRAPSSPPPTLASRDPGTSPPEATPVGAPGAHDPRRHAKSAVAVEAAAPPTPRPDPDDGWCPNTILRIPKGECGCCTDPDDPARPDPESEGAP